MGDEPHHRHIKFHSCGNRLELNQSPLRFCKKSWTFWEKLLSNAPMKIPLMIWVMVLSFLYSNALVADAPFVGSRKGGKNQLPLGAACAQHLQVAIQTHDERFRSAARGVREFLRGIPDAELKRILELESEIRPLYKELRKSMMKEKDFWEIRKNVMDSKIPKLFVAEKNAAVLAPLKFRYAEVVHHIASMEFEKGFLVLKNFIPPGKSFDGEAYSYLRNADLTEYWQKRIARFDQGLEPHSYPGASWKVTLWRQPESVAQAEHWVVYRVLFAGDSEELWELPPFSIDNGSSTRFFQPKGKDLHPMPPGPGGENVTYNTQNTRAIGEIEVAHIAYQYDESFGKADWKGLMGATYTRMIGGQLPKSCWKSLKYDGKRGLFNGAEIPEVLPPDQRPRLSGPLGDLPVENSRVVPLGL